MFGSDAKLGEVKRKRGQDNCISRAAPFRGRLPLHERNNVKLFPVALDYLSLQSRNLDGGLSILVQPSSRWCPACRTDGLAVPALASLESLVLRLVFLDTSCCHLWWSSSCSGSSPAFWLAVVWQTVVTHKPCRCPSVPATGGVAPGPRHTSLWLWRATSPHMAWCCLCHQLYRCNTRFFGRRDAGLPVWSSTQA